MLGCFDVFKKYAAKLVPRTEVGRGVLIEEAFTGRGDGGELEILADCAFCWWGWILHLRARLLPRVDERVTGTVIVPRMVLDWC